MITISRIKEPSYSLRVIEFHHEPQPNHFKSDFECNINHNFISELSRRCLAEFEINWDVRRIPQFRDKIRLKESMNFTIDLFNKINSSTNPIGNVEPVNFIVKVDK